MTKTLILVSNRGPVALAQQKRRHTAEEFEARLREENARLGLTEVEILNLTARYEALYGAQLAALIVLEAKKVPGEKEYDDALAALLAQGKVPLADFSERKQVGIKEILAERVFYDVYVPVHSAGGLAAALRTARLHEKGVKPNWVCWLGNILGGIDPESANAARLAADASAVVSTAALPVSAVLIPADEQKAHYEKVANDMLWPLMHGVRIDLVLTASAAQTAALTAALGDDELTAAQQTEVKGIITNPPVNIASEILTKAVTSGVASLAEVELKILDATLANPTLLLAIERAKFIEHEADPAAGVAVEYTAEYEDAWAKYESVNHRFALATNRRIAVAKARGEDPVVWCHDYHLLMAAKEIREEHPDVPLHYFHHIPFPRPEIFSLMPHAEELLEAWLQYDEIRFHSEVYVTNFKDTVRAFIAAGKLPGWDVTATGQIFSPGSGAGERREVKVAATPIGIDYDTFATPGGEYAEVEEMVAEIRARAAEKLGDPAVGGIEPRIVFAGGRADYSKGFIELLQAYKSLLEELPDLVRRREMAEEAGGDLEAFYQRINAIKAIQLILQGSPTRGAVPAYNALWQRISQLVGQVQALQAELGLPAMTFCPKSFPLAGVITLNRSADVVAVPVRSSDGFNLMAPEALACWAGRADPATRSRGNLILGTGAGVHAHIAEGVLSVDSSATEKDFIRELAEQLIADPVPEARVAAAQAVVRDRLRVSDWVKACAHIAAADPALMAAAADDGTGEAAAGVARRRSSGDGFDTLFGSMGKLPTGDSPPLPSPIATAAESEGKDLASAAELVKALIRHGFAGAGVPPDDGADDADAADNAAEAVELELEHKAGEVDDAGGAPAAARAT